MEEKDNKKIFNKIFWKIFLALLFGFFALYVSEATGYYEFKQHKKVNLTNESIKKFEEDIENGRNININDYINKKEVSYENEVSSIGLTLSETIENCMQNGLKNTFDFLNKVFNGK